MNSLEKNVALVDAVIGGNNNITTATSTTSSSVSAASGCTSTSASISTNSSNCGFPLAAGSTLDSLATTYGLTNNNNSASNGNKASLIIKIGKSEMNSAEVGDSNMNEHSSFRLEELPANIRFELDQLELELLEGDITQKGYEKKRNKLLSTYIGSTPTTASSTTTGNNNSNNGAHSSLSSAPLASKFLY
jgi:hypothetical protein